MTLSSEGIGVQTLSAGERVLEKLWRRVFTLTQEQRIGIVAAGYADGCLSTPCADRDACAGGRYPVPEQ